jgi:Flp pilus assembly CpaE family ATPase
MRKALLLAALLGATGAQAEDASWVEELGTIDAQIQLLQKREELAVQQQTASQRCLAGLPKVVAIYEFAGQRSAQLHYPNGQLQEVRTGAQVAVGARVSGIAPQMVQVNLNCAGQQSVIALEFTSNSRQQAVIAARSQVQTSTSATPVASSLQPNVVVGAPAIRLDSPLPPVPGAQ